MTRFVVRRADTPPLLEAARAMFAEYAAMPHTVGRWDHSGAESAALPGPYAPPAGGLLLALVDDEPVGCVGIRPLDPPAVCEMKRLYVRDAARGRGAGRTLVVASLVYARGAGYATMRLDTVPELHAAVALYRALGFREIAPYHDAYGGVVFFEIDLRAGAAEEGPPP